MVFDPIFLESAEIEVMRLLDLDKKNISNFVHFYFEELIHLDETGVSFQNRGDSKSLDGHG